MIHSGSKEFESRNWISQFVISNLNKNEPKLEVTICDFKFKLNLKDAFCDYQKGGHKL